MSKRPRVLGIFRTSTSADGLAFIAAVLAKHRERDPAYEGELFPREIVDEVIAAQGITERRARSFIRRAEAFDKRLHGGLQ